MNCTLIRDTSCKKNRGAPGPPRIYKLAHVGASCITASNTRNAFLFQEAHTSSDGARRSWWSWRCSTFSRGPTCPPTYRRQRIKTSVAGKEPPSRRLPQEGVVRRHEVRSRGNAGSWNISSRIFRAFCGAASSARIMEHWWPGNVLANG